MSEIFIKCTNTSCDSNKKVLSSYISTSDAAKKDYGICMSCGSKFEEVSKKDALKYSAERNKKTNLDFFADGLTEEKHDKKEEVNNKSPKKYKNIFIYIVIIIIIILMFYFSDGLDGPPRFFKDVR